jgi:hypothetical protein
MAGLLHLDLTRAGPRLSSLGFIGPTGQNDYVDAHPIHRARPPRTAKPSLGSRFPEQSFRLLNVNLIRPQQAGNSIKNVGSSIRFSCFSRRPGRFDAAGSPAFQGFAQRLYEQFIAEGLTQEGHRPGGQCLLADSDLVVRRDKNQWDRAAGRGEPILHVKAVHSRHLHIDNQTVGLK